MGLLKTLASFLLLVSSLVFYFKLKDKLKINTMVIISSIFGFRVILSFILHIVLKMQFPSDVPIFYGHAMRILEGEIPSMDFSFPYGIIFGYLLAFSVYLYNSPISIIFLFHLFEFLGLILINKSIVKTLSQNQRNNLFILYFLNPVSFIALGLTGQDESVLLFIVSLFLYLTLKPNYLAIIAGIFSLLISKFFALMCFAGYFLRDKIVRSVILIISLVLVFTFLYSMGFSIVDFNVTIDSNTTDQLLSKVTSGNIWFLLKLISLDLTHTMLPMILTLVTIASLYIYFFFLEKNINHKQTFVIVTTISFLLFGLFYKMTFSQYFAIIIPLILLIVFEYKYSLRLFITFLMWSSLVAVDSTLYYYFNYYIGFRGFKFILLLLYQASQIGLSIYLIFKILNFKRCQ